MQLFEVQLIITKMKYLLFLLVIFFLTSCATKKNKYRNNYDFATKSSDTIKNFQSFYLIGNFGSGKKGINKKLLPSFHSFITKNSNKKDYLIFLGDNIHANKIKKVKNKDQLIPQINLIRDFVGTSVMIPGEHDWNDEGLKGLENVEDYIEEKLGKDNHFQPENGCPIEVEDIDERTALIIVDSQWYIENWNLHTKFNDKCGIKTRSQFITRLSDEVRKARHKNVILVMHHPLYSNGIFGGEVGPQFFYQPSIENAYIPGLGLLWAFIRSQGGISKQDRFNPLMNELMSQIKTIAMQAPRFFVLSGHEMSLQYIEHDGLRQIISGTASKTKPARLGKDGYFSSGQPGFAELRLFEDRSSQIVFYTLNENGKLRQSFKKEAFEAPHPFDTNALPESFPKYYTASIYPPEAVDVDADYVRKWGEHYRYLYGKMIKAPVAVLDTLYGGLRVERAGGGNQTQSLRLVDKDDKEYNMRALAKDPHALLKASGYNDLDTEHYFSETILEDMLEDFYTAAHPYGAFAIPKLAGAANIYHTHPKLFYVPKQRALGDFNKVHGDRLYMIVEKPDEDFKKSHMFGDNSDVESTGDLFEALRKDEIVQVFEKRYIRSRIFDMLIGDWDRHEDQWRWGKSTSGDKVIFNAIPRDRDQVFANFDGKFLETLQKYVGSTRQFGKFGEDIEFIEQFNQSAIVLDRRLLQKSGLHEWLEQVAFLQNEITDEVIDKAFKDIPVEAQDEVWDQIKVDLKKRRRNLENLVRRYYNHLITFQTLFGTDKDDHFIIEQRNDSILSIKAYRIKDKKDKYELFNKEYNINKTKQIWIYGLDDEDFFEVVGNRNSKIEITLIGGMELFLKIKYCNISTKI